MQVTLTHAKTHLPDLLKAVENGATVVITRYKKPIASLVPYSSVKRIQPKLGTAPPSVRIIDSNWAKPLTEKELNDLVSTGAY